MNTSTDTISKEPKRVAIVYNSAWYLIHFRAPLIRELQAIGYEVHAITPADGHEKGFKDLGLVYHEFPLIQHGTNPFKELVSLYSLARTLKRIQPELVISYTIKCNMYCGMIRKLLGYHQIVNIVGLGRAFEQKGMLSRFARLLYRFSIHSADAVFFQNTEDRDSFVEQGIVPHANTVVTPGSGVDLSTFSHASARTPKHGRFVFFMFGRLIPAKGFDLFVNAIETIRSSLPDSGAIQCWIAGGLDGDRPASLSLKNRLETAEKNGLVRYLGHREDIRSLIDQSDVIVLPSTYNEGVPRSLIEALACGKPVITTNWKGCRETVDSNRNGRLVAPHDVQSLANAMTELFTSPAETLQEMGKASRAFAEKKFDQRLVLRQYLDVISQLP